MAAYVTGRARTPSDQGSVERANRTIKPIIDDFVIDKQRLVDDPDEKKFLDRIIGSPLSSFLSTILPKF